MSRRNKSNRFVEDESSLFDGLNISNTKISKAMSRRNKSNRFVEDESSLFDGLNISNTKISTFSTCNYME